MNERVVLNDGFKRLILSYLRRAVVPSWYKIVSTNHNDTTSRRQKNPSEVAATTNSNSSMNERVVLNDGLKRLILSYLRVVVPAWYKIA